MPSAISPDMSLSSPSMSPSTPIIGMDSPPADSDIYLTPPDNCKVTKTHGNKIAAGDTRPSPEEIEAFLANLNEFEANILKVHTEPHSKVPDYEGMQERREFLRGVVDILREPRYESASILQPEILNQFRNKQGDIYNTANGAKNWLSEVENMVIRNRTSACREWQEADGELYRVHEVLKFYYGEEEVTETANAQYERYLKLKSDLKDGLAQIAEEFPEYRIQLHEGVQMAVNDTLGAIEVANEDIKFFKKKCYNYNAAIDKFKLQETAMLDAFRISYEAEENRYLLNNCAQDT